MLPLEGGKATAVTSGIAFDSQPRVSPDGRRLVFVSDRDGGENVWVMELDTGKLQPVTDARHAFFTSPDGRWLAYGARHAGDTVMRPRDLNTGEDSILFRTLDRDHQETVPGLDFLPGASFTPDSRAVVVAAGGRFKRIAVPSGAVTNIPFSADVKLTVGPRIEFTKPVSDAPVKASQLRDPALAPDQSRIAFTAFGSVWVMKLPDGAPQRLTATLPAIAQHPVWSRDGRSIVYVTWNDNQGGHLWSVPADGSVPAKRISQVPGYYAYPAITAAEDVLVWRGSADEYRAQLLTGQTGHRLGLTLTRIPAGVGEALELLRITARCVENGSGYGSCLPRLSLHDDDRAVAFLTPDGRMLSAPVDGGEPREIFSAASLGYFFFRRAEPVAADQAVLSPDGRHAVVRTGARLYAVNLASLPDRPHLFLIDDAGPGFREINAQGGEFPFYATSGPVAVFSLGSTVFQVDISAFLENGTPAQAFTPVLEVPRFQSDQPLLLSGARIISMVGNQVVEDGDILLRRGRIAAIGRRGTFALPASVETIDVTGMTIIPGLVDVHMHVRLTRGILSRQPWELATNLAYGITTGLDPAPSTDLQAYADMTETGYTLGPRLYSTGPIIGFDEGLRLHKFQAARTTVSRFKDYYDVPLIKQYMTGNRHDQQMLIAAAFERQTGATTEGGPSVIYSFLEEGGRLENEKAKRFLPDPWRVLKVDRRPWSFSARELVHQYWAQDIADLIERGANVALGNHGDVPGLGTHWEMQALAEGIKPHDVLRMATIMGARHIGMQEDIGTLEVGKKADLLVLSRNPLEDIRHAEAIRYVIKDGVVRDARSLERVWPEKSESHAALWWTRIE